MPNKDLAEISEKVLSNSNLPQEDKFGFDPITIIMIIAIIVNVIRVIQECNKEKKNSSDEQEYCTFLRDRIKELCNRRSFISVMRLKKILRRHMNKDDYYKYKEYLINGLIKTGSELSENETYTLLEHSND